MTQPTLHYHPLSSYCHKVLIAIDVLGAQVDKRLLNLGDPAEREAFVALWPTGKMPLLVDQGAPLQSPASSSSTFSTTTRFRASHWSRTVRTRPSVCGCGTASSTCT